MKWALIILVLFAAAFVLIARVYITGRKKPAERSQMTSDEGTEDAGEADAGDAGE